MQKKIYDRVETSTVQMTAQKTFIRAVTRRISSVLGCMRKMDRDRFADVGEIGTGHEMTRHVLLKCQSRDSLIKYYLKNQCVCAI